MHRHNLLRERIIQTLETTSRGLSQLELMCLCHGYRYTHGKLLYFSVQERLFKQTRDDHKVEELLQTVLKEADDEYAARKLDVGSTAAKRYEQNRRSEVYDLREPKTEIIVRAPHKQLMMGITDVSPLAENISRIAKLLPHYEYMSEQVILTEYAKLNTELESKLAKYPRVVWSKIKIERTLFEDENITRHVRTARQATNRALKHLEKKRQVVKRGEPAKARYMLPD